MPTDDPLEVPRVKKVQLEVPPPSRYIEINRCPAHGYWSIAISTRDRAKDHGTGLRLTPSKCCGRWDTVKSWRTTKAQLLADIEREWPDAD